MCNVVLSIGSNYQQQTYFPKAFAALTDAFGELHFSPVYESVAMVSGDDLESSGGELQKDDTEQPLYYNLVVGFNSDKTISEIQSIIHCIEDDCGRDRSTLCSSSLSSALSPSNSLHSNLQPSHLRVTIDIDLLLYGDETGEVEGVVLPRKDILTYAYVLRPLSDLFPERLHPEVKRSFHCLWQAFCEKSKQISRLKPVDFVWQGQVISIAPSCAVI